MPGKIPVIQDNSSHQPRASSALNPTGIYPKAVTGFFSKVRTLGLYAFLAGYFLTPWLQWNGRQAILIDLPDRKFYVFNYTFWPQDLFLLSLFAISAAFGLFLITTYAGRVWCGYTCPQTVWTKIFISIETFVEGSRHQRMKLANTPWTLSKIRKRFFTHTLWLSVSLVTALGFLLYFTPAQQFFDKLISFELNTWQTYWLAFFTIATYINAGWMREQICLHGCPYARIQSIMFDADTLIVSYDAARGEARGSRKKNSDYKKKGLGDCIDCMQCVHVCPTGIDIRNGLQYECIACAACVDACDKVMDKMGYEKGLVRYTTESASYKRPALGLLRPQIIIVTILLGIVGITTLTLLFTRLPVELTVSRDRSALYRNTSMGLVENSYILKIMNKSQRAEIYRISVSAINKLHYRGPESVLIEAGEVRSIPIGLEADPNNLTIINQVLHFHITSERDNKLNVKQISRFIGPLWVEQN
ncbi:MAG: cytochrome c oxidase accessory protein CcoG [Gammaproteobacteria bacterium]|nr:cytochrome c oxidase accessory protein CcoG [Gammaproteobacteria bacterium]